MKEYNFYSINQRKALILFVFLFTLFFALIFGMTSLKNIFNVYVTITLSFGIPFLIFWLNRKKIKENCLAKISENKTEIKIDEKLNIINFEEIKSYKIDTYNTSIGLSIKFKNDTSFKISTNSNYGETKIFQEYCNDLANNIEIYNKLNNVEIERSKTFFEKSFILPFLIIITLILLIFVIIIISKGKGFPISLLSALAPLLALWGGYFNAKNKKT